MCCSDSPFLCLVLRVFQQSYPFPPIKQGLSDVLLFCDSFLVFVLRVFFNSPTQFPPIKQGLSDVLLFVIPFFVFGLKSIFQQSYPIPTYESRDWVMCCSFVIPFLCLVLRVFNSLPNSHQKQGGMMCCSFDSFLCVV
jgi:hypothetical protein